MRLILLTAALLALASTRAGAADPTFVRVWPQWHDADSFQSFYEYETSRELTGKWIVLRSQPEERTGLYFLVRLDNPEAEIVGASYVVSVITPDTTDTKTYSFPVNIPPGSQVFEIGLTGRDWAGPHVQPVAWDVELHGADGRVLARKSSFLWEKSRR